MSRCRGSSGQGTLDGAGERSPFLTVSAHPHPPTDRQRNLERHGVQSTYPEAVADVGVQTGNCQHGQEETGMGMGMGMGRHRSSAGANMVPHPHEQAHGIVFADTRRWSRSINIQGEQFCVSVPTQSSERHKGFSSFCFD